MLRTGRTYQLLITRYQVGTAQNGRRPPLQSQTLFRGVHGHLKLELWGKDKAQGGSVAPAFYTRGGEPLEVPAGFEAATLALTKAVGCRGCSHSHYLVAPPAVAAAVRGVAVEAS
jgi:hypothetical protein